MSDSYGIRRGYVSRARPEYFVDDVCDTSNIVWQPDVYQTAARVAKKLHVKRIVDIGCGRGHKLAALHPTFDIVGVDYGNNIEACLNKYSFGTWLQSDLDGVQPLPQTLRLSSAVVVCSDVIEHLTRPEFLLTALREALIELAALVISTPDRELTRGPNDLGPPANPAHVREWTLEEFATLLRRFGFETGELRLTRSNDRSRARRTILAVLYGSGRKQSEGLRVAVWQNRIERLRAQLERVSTKWMA